MCDKTVKSFCRLCQGFCGYELTVNDNKITRLKADKSDPVSQGYACFKGLKAVDFYHSPKRITRSLQRHKPSQDFSPVDTQTALENAAADLLEIVREHGPESVAVFVGTQALYNSISPFIVNSFMQALGSPRLYKTMTIDQSAKWIAEARMGSWQAGSQAFGSADVWMVVGNNPLVSMTFAGGPNLFVFENPKQKIERAKARGMKLIVVDPRRTDIAEYADLFLQIQPGRDTELAAALLHVILREQWHDQEFCDEYVDGLEQLKNMVSKFAPDKVADTIGVSVDEIERAAEMFANNAKSGMVGTGVGPNMARFSNTSEHLYQAINVVCGRYPRAGDTIANSSVMQPRFSANAEVTPVNREWETSFKSSSHGLGTIKDSMMSAEIADEIQYSGRNKLRAMICIGGNLQIALPDQAAAEKALSELDFLLVIDPVMTGTARLADYVIAPKLQYERSDQTLALERMFEVPFANMTGPIVEPPEGSDVVDDWRVFWELAKGLELDMQFAGQPLDLASTPPTTEQLMSMLSVAGQVPSDEIQAHGAAAIYDVAETVVGERLSDTRFDLFPDDVAAEVQQVHQELLLHRDTEFRLIVRRHKDLMNSTGAEIEATRKVMPHNPVYMHPRDMQAKNFEQGDSVIIQRNGKQIGGNLKADDSLLKGVVAVSHGWSGRASHPWEASNALVESDEGAAPINRMPIMTGFEVSVRLADEA